MNIFDNFIQDTEIIGIGRLNLNENACSNGSGLVTYSFKVLTKSSSLTIYSNECVVGTDYETTWLEKFAQVRIRILAQIKEIDYNADRSRFIDHVSNEYETLKDTVTDLLSDLRPAEICKKPINPRIEKLYDSIRKMRDLACTAIN